MLWVRTWDSITVPFFGGVAPGRARNLGFYDATLGALWDRRPEEVPPPLAKIDRPDYYRRLNVDPVLKARPFSSTWEGLVGDLLAELERVEPLTVVAPHPFLDRHRDHQFATIALIEAVERAGCTCHIKEGEAVFYAPKVEADFREVLGRAWTLGTIQIDLAQPGRFGLRYVGRDG